MNIMSETGSVRDQAQTNCLEIPLAAAPVPEGASARQVKLTELIRICTVPAYIWPVFHSCRNPVGEISHCPGCIA